MSKKSILWNKLSLGILISVFVWACKEDPNKTGLGLLPTGDLISVGHVVDKESLRSYTLMDSIQRTDEPEYSLLGTFNDPLFGKTKSNIAMQPRLVEFPLYYGLNGILDSLVLYLRYKEFYGDTLTPQTFTVYELASDIYRDEAYYQDADLKSLAGSKLAEYTYTPKLKLDTVIISSIDTTARDTIVQELAITLDATYAEKLLNADSLDLISNEAFLQVFKGLYIESGDLGEGGALMRIYNSIMYLYYHTDTIDSLYFPFYVNDNSARISSFEHDYSSAMFFSNFDNEDEEDSLIYIQPMGGLRDKIYIDELETWKDSADDIVLNKAELVFQVDTVLSDLSNYNPPEELVLTALDSTNGQFFPEDLIFSKEYYGGAFHEEDATYRFNITQHMQKVIEVDSIGNYGFYLSAEQRSSNVKRVVLKGARSAPGIRFEVTYSKLK